MHIEFHPQRDSELGGGELEGKRWRKEQKAVRENVAHSYSAMHRTRQRQTAIAVKAQRATNPSLTSCILSCSSLPPFQSILLSHFLFTTYNSRSVLFVQLNLAIRLLSFHLLQTNSIAVSFAPKPKRTATEEEREIGRVTETKL